MNKHDEETKTTSEVEQEATETNGTENASEGSESSTKEAPGEESTSAGDASGAELLPTATTVLPKTKSKSSASAGRGRSKSSKPAESDSVVASDAVQAPDEAAVVKDEPNPSKPKKAKKVEKTDDKPPAPEKTERKTSEFDLTRWRRLGRR